MSRCKGVWAGGARGAAAFPPPPPKFWAIQIFGAAREYLGKASFFSRRFQVFYYYYFEEINIFYFNLKSA